MPDHLSFLPPLHLLRAPSVVCPPSHHKPKGKGKKLAAVSEDAEAAPQEISNHARGARNRGLSLRTESASAAAAIQAAGEQRGSKRKSEDEAIKSKRACSEEEKTSTTEYTYDQLLEINAKHKAAQAASDAASMTVQASEKS